LIIYNKFFTWDEHINRGNAIKHKVNFKEASTVFSDTDAVVLDDTEHSKDEERFIIIGKSKHERILMVCHCYRQNDELIRIISARKAEEDEEEIYEMGGVRISMTNKKPRYDLSTARKNPYAERLKKGYSIIINVPPEEVTAAPINDFYVSDEELHMLKEFVASEEEKRIRANAG